MVRRTIIFLCLVVVSAFANADTATFTTKRLEALASSLKLQQLDTLRAGVVSEGYEYKGRKLVVRVNEWREIEHIGLKFFATSMRETAPSPVYDFLERTLLEYQAVPAGSEQEFMLQSNRIHFNTGSPKTALRIDSTFQFQEEYVSLKVYRVGWSKNQQKVLELSFEMDYQMLTGCNILELEQLFAKHLNRYTFRKEAQKHPQIKTKGSEYTVVGKSFLIPQIKNDTYYTKENKEWKLVIDERRPSKTIANLMLCPQASEHLPMKMTMEVYGLRRDSVCTTYGKWLQFCMNEGCVPYYGMKSKTGDDYTGAVFLVNEKGGYMHLLSIRIPLSLLGNPKQDGVSLFGRLHAYIPLNNVSENVLRTSDYQPIK